MSVTQNFSSVQPTLSLNFARSKTLDSRITFARASVATRINDRGLVETVSAGVPRFQHSYNSTTGTISSLGLLIEESRTNLLTYSEQFNNVVWLKTRCNITTDVTISPDGTTTAEKFVEDTTASSSHYVYANNINVTANTSYTFSVFLKSAERTFAAIEICDGPTATNACRVGINLSTGVVGTPFNTGSATGASSTITSYPNGWYRVSISGIVDSSSTSIDCIVYDATSSISSGYPLITGDGTSGIYIWGAQLERGSFATSYIPTTTTTFQRNADDVSITGTNFSDWFNSNQGTVYTQFKTELNITNNIWSINNYPTSTFGTTANYFRLLTLSNNIHTQYNVATVNLYPVFSLANNSMKKVIQSYNISSSPIVSSLNGTLGTGSGNIYSTAPGFNQLEFGKNVDARSTIGQYIISQLVYYPRKLSNTQLQTLTQ